MIKLLDLLQLVLHHNMSAAVIRQELKKHINPAKAAQPLFFKTGLGGYAEHDQFLGISVPILRTIARQFCDASFSDITILLQSKFNEERLLALFILIIQYNKNNRLIWGPRAQSNEHGVNVTKQNIYNFYTAHIAHINNWNLVDASAHETIGAYLFHYTRDKNVLLILAHSDNLWQRRIAMIATLYFIRQGDTSWTYDIADILLHDTHDLIHKAVGWMLREAGKKNEDELKHFLNKHAHHMPRTMLRYAIEKLSPDMRAFYMNQ